MKRVFQAGRLIMAVLLLFLGQSIPGVWGATCGSISGKVTNQTATAVGSVTVNIYDAGNHVIAGRGSSGVDGRYTVIGLPAGSYKVEFDSGGISDYLTQWYGAKSDFTSANVVSVASGGDTLDINATLAHGGSIAGTVSSSTTPGMGIPGVVSTIYNSATNTAIGSTATGAGGSYLFTRLPTGSYKVRFSRGAEGCFGVTWYNARPDSATADPVPVTAGSGTSGINAFFPTGTINGTVTAANGATPLFQASVRVKDAATGTYSTTRNTTAAGNYEFTDLSPGSYKIQFSSPVTAVPYVTEWYIDKYSEATADSVALAAGETKTANASLAPGGTITGVVTDSSTGAGIMFATVMAYDSVDQVASAVTDDTGAYTLNGLRTGGSYKIQFTHGGHVSQWYANKSTQPEADPVAVPTLTPVTGINARLVTGSCPNTGSISGKVIGPCGAPAAYAMVYALDAVGQIAQTSTDESGNYTLPCLASGAYTVFFSDLKVYVATALATVAAPGGTALPDAALSMGGSISGRVVDASGQGVANARVKLFDAAGFSVMFGATTDSGGNYVAGVLPSGGYLVFVSHTGCSGGESAWYNNQALVTVTAPTGVTGIDIAFGGPSPHHQLTVVPAGSGSGSVSSTPPGIDCPSGLCAASFPAGQVILTAQAPAGSVFAGWSGGCSGTGICTVNLLADAIVTATFNNAPPPTRTVTVTVDGAGSVSSTPAGITCPSVACTAQISVSSQVTLTPNLTPGSVFAGWSGGGCSSTGVCIVAPGSSTVATTATFLPATVKWGSYYSLSIIDAYVSAADGDTIQAEDRSFAESLNLNRGIACIMDGGYNSAFSAVTGATALQAPFVVRTGKVTVANILIK